MSKISIDLSNLVKLGADGKTFFWNPDAEASLQKLLETKDLVENMISTVKKELAEAGTKENPDFGGVRGSHVHASYGPHGAKYELTVDGSKVESAFVSAKVSYAIDSKAVDKYVAANGETPEGIATKNREKSVTLKLV